MQDLKLIPAGIQDLQTISALARVVWNQHYPAMISAAQIDYMLDLMYSHESLKGQVDKGHRFFLISRGGEPAGFISVNREDGDAWFLNKFYIDQQQASQGMGTAALKEIMRLLSPRKMTLTVNRQNYKSINFYFKQGFKIERVADFDIGNGYAMNDFVMTWKM